ncbi:DUF3558 domain-containing protein [Streptomyces sp. NPDC088747]|uniref:DUF3558 domain-containing protein n=1 Tax=Streptomyces sp. NPDC088747 TaxID=3365886 RepID=UPI00381B2122
MQRKAYVTGVTALLAALLAGCTGGSDGDGATDDSKPGDSGTKAAVAQPGRYRTLPEACAAIDHGTLDSLLPGIRQIADEERRGTAYEGTPTLTYDTDRRVGCRWKVESDSATDHLLVDFERVVSYDNAVSDDSRATDLYTIKETAADLPEPSASATPEDSESPDAGDSASPSGSPSASSSANGGSSPSSTPSGSASASSSSSDASSSSPSADATPTSLQPRVLDGLGDQAYLDDTLSPATSTAQQRTVTVVFRTSNVIVTIEYDEQPTVTGEVPDSKEMQDRARNLAAKLADTLNG